MRTSFRCNVATVTSLLLASSAAAQNVTGLQSEECGSTSSGASMKCADIQWEVQVFRIHDRTGSVKACLASFGYNGLNIRTGQALEGTTVTWYLAPDANAQFVGAGINITKGSGSGNNDPQDLFDAPNVQPAQVSIGVKKNIPGNKKYNHKPVVQLTDYPYVPPCDGVDPTIGNSAN
jgi:hypothetical protein